MLVFGAADQLWCKLVHGDSLSAEVPDIDVLKIVRTHAKRRINVLEAVQAACPVQLQIDIQHSAPRTLESKPVCALCNRDGEFYQGKGLTCLGRPCKEHFVALAEHSVDQAVRQIRDVVPDICKLFRVWKIILYVLGPLFPFLP